MSAMDKIFGAMGINKSDSQNKQQNNQNSQNQQTQPGNLPNNDQNPPNNNNPTVPQNGNPGTDFVSSLDNYKDLWKNDTTNTPEPEGLFPNVTRETLNASAKKNDFSKVLTPEMLAAINAGGESGVAATIQAMNAMSQKGFADSALATTQIVEQALAKQQKKFEEMLPSLLKNQTVTENLRTSNPLFSHPATAPILDVFKEQALRKFPSASAVEIQAMANNYLEEFAKAASPKKQETQINKNDTDWEEFFN